MKWDYWDYKPEKGIICRVTRRDGCRYSFRGISIMYGEGEKYDALVVAPGYQLDDFFSLKKNKNHTNVVLAKWDAEIKREVIKSKNPQRLINKIRIMGKGSFLEVIRSSDIDFVYDDESKRNRVIGFLQELSIITSTPLDCNTFLKLPTPDHLLIHIDFLDQILTHPTVKEVVVGNYWQAYALDKKRDKHQWGKILDVDYGTVIRWINKYGIDSTYDNKVSIKDMEAMIRRRVSENSDERQRKHWANYLSKIVILRRNERLHV